MLLFKSLMNARSYYLAMFIFFLFVSSCEKEQFLSRVSVNKTEAELSSQFSDLPSKVLNGRLVFDSADDFYKAIEEVNNLTDNDLDIWEAQLHFNSERKFIVAVREAYEQLNTKEELDEFLSKYQGKIHFEDGSISGKVPFRNISAFVGTDGWVYVGQSLYKFTENQQIIIQDGQEEKIAVAERLSVTDEDSGIHIFYQLGRGREPAIGRSCGSYCSSYLSQWEDKDSDGDKRLKYWWSGFVTHTILANGNYNTRYHYYRKIESRKKSGFIWKRTWINVEFDHHVSVCFQNCNFSEQNLNFNSIHTAVADFEAVSELLLLEDQLVSCFVRHTRIDSSVDRIESPNTNDLQVAFMCD